MKFRKRRVVILGEAGLFSAQVVRFPDGRELKFGLNVPGHDDRQFALNVLHLAIEVAEITRPALKMTAA